MTDSALIVGEVSEVVDVPGGSDPGELSGSVGHCEQPMQIDKRLFWWRGDYGHEVIRLSCSVCGAAGTLTLRAPAFREAAKSR